MNVINNYFKQLQDVYNYFGFKEDWVVYPLEDLRKYHWRIVNNEEVQFGAKDDITNDNGNYFVNEIYKQRFYNKWVYRGEEYTMIIVDTHTDGNKFFGIYDNLKEV